VEPTVAEEAVEDVQMEPPAPPTNYVRKSAHLSVETPPVGMTGAVEVVEIANGRAKSASMDPAVSPFVETSLVDQMDAEGHAENAMKASNAPMAGPAKNLRVCHRAVTTFVEMTDVALPAGNVTAIPPAKRDNAWFPAREAARDFHAEMMVAACPAESACPERPAEKMGPVRCASTNAMERSAEMTDAVEPAVIVLKGSPV
jgi:predicted component of type VI protein secretion system